ncbi:MAG: SHOCT domain-containing protein [Alphaproteobacteria bacterium]|nr:SHOCT domain-containing protein [Alphaproteobacteria bacterium]
MWLNGQMMGWHDFGWWWMLPFGHFWLLVLLVVLVAVLFSRSTRRYPLPPRRSAALDLLEQRYARGEIGRDEYLEKKRDLESHA